jgi:hypothetical protein
VIHSHHIGGELREPSTLDSWLDAAIAECGTVIETGKKGLTSSGKHSAGIRADGSRS